MKEEYIPRDFLTDVDVVARYLSEFLKRSSMTINEKEKKKK